MTPPMLEATTPQLVLFIASLGLILAAGYFIARPRK